MNILLHISPWRKIECKVSMRECANVFSCFVSVMSLSCHSFTFNCASRICLFFPPSYCIHFFLYFFLQHISHLSQIKLLDGEDEYYKLLLAVESVPEEDFSSIPPPPPPSGPAPVSPLKREALLSQS